MYWLIAIPIWIICGVIAGYFARIKGYSNSWYVWGFLFGVFALLIVGLLTDRVLEERINNLNVIVSDLRKNKNDVYVSAEWKCKNCNAFNSINYKYCPICGTENNDFNSENWKCKSCNSYNSNSFNYCVVCGTKKPTQSKKNNEKTVSDVL